METKLLGLVLFITGIYLFKLGLKIDDFKGAHLMNIRLIGSALLLFVGGVALIVTEKKLCEIFGVFC